MTYLLAIKFPRIDYFQFMFGDARCMCWIPTYRLDKKFPDGNLVLDKVFLWGSAIFTPVRSL
jgi:hypothetical protein